jgi:hypothetical protein
LIVGWLGSLSASWVGLYASLFMTSLVGVAIGLVVSAAARTGEVAAGVLPLVILPMVILGGILLPLYELPTSPAPMRLLASTMPSRWAFESLLLPEAAARPQIDTGVSPPTVFQAQEPRSTDTDTRRDMADAFFKQEDRWADGSVIGFFVLLSQVTLYLVLVGFLLLWRDTV